MIFKQLQRHSIATGMIRTSTFSSQNTESNLSIFSHNVGQDLPDYNSLDNLICKVDADIVLLQEITRDYVDGHWGKLSHIYRYLSYGPFVEKKHIASGILSKHPIIKVDNFKLADIGIVPQQQALIDIKGNIVSIYNIHLTFPWIDIRRDPLFSFVPWPKYNHHARSAEIDNLIKMLIEDNHPTIAAGDFNLTSWSDDYKKLTKIVTDAFLSSRKKTSFSWPANRTPSLYIPFATPLVRIDYLFHSSSFQTQRAQFLAKTGSDHLPLLVEIII